MTNSNSMTPLNQKPIVKIIDNVKLLVTNENEILNLNSILNENFSENLLYLKEQIKLHVFINEVTIYINGTTKEYSFTIKSDNQETINLIQSIIEKATN